MAQAASLSAVATSAAPAVRHDPHASASTAVEDHVLLSLSEGACHSAQHSPRNALVALPCIEQQASALFELASRWTSPAAGFSPPDADALHRYASACSSALGQHSERLSAWTLASVAALAALQEAARRELASGSLPKQTLALLTEDPSPLLHGRALFALGALFPALPSRELRTQTQQHIAEGLAHTDRFVFRQAVLAAVLSQDSLHDAALLQSLLRSLHVSGSNAPKPSEAAPLPAIPAALGPAIVTELVPLLPPYVELLLQSADPLSAATAERLLDAVIQIDPLSGIAHYLRARVLDRARDGRALAALRHSLSLGNLPATFVDELGERARALTPDLDLEAAHRRLRQLLRLRRPIEPGKPPFRLTAKELDHTPPSHPLVPQVSPAALEVRAAAVFATEALSSPAALTMGQELFRLYPFSSQTDYDSCLRSFLFPDGKNHDLLDALGLQVHGKTGGTHVIPGLVLVRDEQADSPSAVRTPQGRYGVTCALCHTQIDATGQRHDGLPSRSYDQGLLLAACIDQPIHYKAQNRNLDQLMSYRPGRNDSSSDGMHNPTEIPSLWGLASHGPVRWNGDTPSLELQIDRNLSSRSAPPAVIALLAAYLRSLGQAAAAEAAVTVAHPARSAGRRVFSKTCARCHEPPLFTNGRVIPLSALGTDATRISAVLPNSGGGYKVPTLLGLSRTAPYLHDGSVPSLEALLDPQRSGGHRFGLSLAASDRAALLQFLHAL